MLTAEGCDAPEQPREASVEHSDVRGRNTRIPAHEAPLINAQSHFGYIEVASNTEVWWHDVLNYQLGAD